MGLKDGDAHKAGLRILRGQRVGIHRADGEWKKFKKGKNRLVERKEQKSSKSTNQKHMINDKSLGQVQKCRGIPGFHFEGKLGRKAQFSTIRWNSSVQNSVRVPEFLKGKISANN